MERNITKLPVEILWGIADACHSPEDIAALALTNEHMYWALFERVTPKVAGFAAIANRDVRLILKTIRLKGAGSMVDGLLHQHTITECYALQVIVTAQDFQVFRVISPFLTQHHDGVGAALCETVHAKSPNFMSLLLPYCSDGHIVRAFERAVYADSGYFAGVLYNAIPIDQRQGTSDELLRMVVLSNFANVRRVVVTGCGNVRTAHALLHWVLDYGQHSGYKPRDLKETVKLLCDAGVDLNSENESGNTPLHILARFGPACINRPRNRGITDKDAHLSCVRTIIAAGPKIDQIEFRGRTALFHAVRSGEVAMVAELIKAGANLYVKDVDDKLIEQIDRNQGPKVIQAANLVRRRIKEHNEELARERKEARAAKKAEGDNKQ